MTEAEAKIILHKNCPNRVIDTIEKRPDGYFISAYDKKVGPGDVSGSTFLVTNDSNIKKLSVFDMLGMAEEED